MPGRYFLQAGQAVQCIESYLMVLSRLYFAIVIKVLQFTEQIVA